MLRKIFIFHCVIAFNISIGSSQSKKETKFRKSFIETTFKETNGKYSKLRKWENIDTIKVYTNNESILIKKEKINPFLNKIEKLSNINFLQTENQDSAQIEILFVSFDELIKYSENSKGSYRSATKGLWISVETNDKNEITKSIIVRDINYKPIVGKRDFRPKSSILTSIGLMGRNSKRGSFKSNKFYNTDNMKLSKYDQRIIRLLYLSDIKAGMTVNEINRFLIKEFDFKAFIKNKS